MLLRHAVLLILAAGATALPLTASAGFLELSVGASWSESTYDPSNPDDNFATSEKIGGNFGYHFNDNSEVELAYQFIEDTSKVGGTYTKLDDYILSANVVQNIAPKTFPFQPYVRIGIGKIWHRAHLEGGLGGGQIVDFAPNPEITGVLGGGLRIYLTRTTAIRGEATTYLPGANISRWQENTAVTFGLSIYF